MPFSMPLALLLALPLALASACVTDPDPPTPPADVRAEHKADLGREPPPVAVVKPEELRLLKIIGHADSLTSAAFFADGARLVTGSADASIRLWDASSGRELARFKGHIQPILAVAAAADGKLLASSAKDLQTRIWDAGTTKELRHMSGAARTLAYSPDFHRLAAGFDDHSVRLFDVETGTLKATLTGHRRGVAHLAFSPSGETLVSADEEGAVIAWNPATGQLLRSAKSLGAAVRSLAFDRTGARLVATTRDRKAWILDAQTLAPIGALDLPTEAGVAAFTRTGDYLLVAGGTRLFEPEPKTEDYSVRLFSLANGRLVAIFTGHTAPVLAISQSEAEGDAVVTASIDETVRYWPAPAAIVAATAVNH